LSLALPSVHAQFDPVGVQVFSYFPQIADGGGSAQKWTTSFTFTNPHPSDTAAAILYFWDNDGNPLPLDFGSGPAVKFNFDLGPQATVTFTSNGNPTATRVGWAVASSSLPLQSVGMYRYSVNGVPGQGVSVPAIPPSPLFSSPATSASGIAIANPAAGAIPITITVIDEHGTELRHTGISLGPLAHASFTVNQIFPSLGSFRGSIRIETQLGKPFFVALVISGDGGVLSSYPAAGMNLAIAQSQRIWKVWQKVLHAAMDNIPAISKSQPTLVIDPSTGGIASNYRPGTDQVYIYLNLAELISDSESELGFVVAHELGHAIQHRMGFVYSTNPEWDADTHGLWLSMLAGYDPYAAAGALGKIYMATGNAGLAATTFDDISELLAALGVPVQPGSPADWHGSFNTRADRIFSTLQQICSSAQMQSVCSMYKLAFHPHFPGNEPLAEPEFRLQPPGVDTERR
jgi:hypothetical protein